MIRKNFIKIKRGRYTLLYFFSKEEINLNRYNSINISVENICLDSDH